MSIHLTRSGTDINIAKLRRDSGVFHNFGTPLPPLQSGSSTRLSSKRIGHSPDIDSVTDTATTSKYRDFGYYGQHSSTGERRGTGIPMAVTEKNEITTTNSKLIGGMKPMEALNCKYLRLNREQVLRLEQLAREEGIDPGIHAHSDVRDIDVYEDIRKPNEKNEHHLSKLAEVEEISDLVSDERDTVESVLNMSTKHSM